LTSTAFTDPAAHDHLYGAATRLARRTSALHAAKIAGTDASATIAEFAADYRLRAAVVADIGCGRGSTALRLSQRLPAARLVTIDRSASLLQAASRRLTHVGARPVAVCADFHHRPLAGGSVDIAAAAFCLYHSPRPDQVVVEVARCLTRRGVAVFATKSADSYWQLDALVADSGLDPHATDRPSLYATFHSRNATDVVGAHMRVRRIEHQRHVFRFRNLGHVSDYLATTPKYRLPPDLATDAERLGDALRARITDQPVTATSTVTYLVATRP
jgi:SAM-dependent methyltransferase